MATDSYTVKPQTDSEQRRQLALLYRLLHARLPVLFNLPGHVERAFRRSICVLANEFLRSSIYGLIILYLLVVSPVMLFSDDVDKGLWFWWAVFPIGVVLAGLWLFTQVEHKAQYVEQVLAVAVWVCLSGTLYGALRLGDSFLGYVAGFESVYIVIIAFSVLRIRLVMALMACLAALVMALALVAVTSVIMDWVSINLFFTAPLLVGLVNGYIQESTGRHDFLLSSYQRCQTALLREVMLAGDRGEDEQQCLASALLAIGENMRWCGVAVVSPGRDPAWEMEAGWLRQDVPGDDDQPEFWHFAAVHRLASAACQRREMVAGPLPPAAPGAGYCLAVPIAINDGEQSVLLCWSEEDQFQDPEFLDFMAQVSDHIGRFLDRIRQKMQLQYMALHDSLTGLYNRSAFIERLSDAMARHRRDPALQICVLFMDLDRFKWVNDNLGHQAGDCLLQTFSERLKANFREDDIIARLGGDEFALVLEGLPIADVMTLVERIRATYDTPITMGDVQVHVVASVGIAFVSRDHRDADAVLGEADTAMYAAKHERAGECRVYDDNLSSRVLPMPGRHR